MEQTFDVVIIGGGPGGSAAARTLAEAGKSVALVEERELGGTCLNRGCVPTKFLLAATAPLGSLHDHSRFGSVSGELRVDFQALQKRKERFVKGSSAALGKALQNSGVTLFSGKGVCKAPGVIEVQGAAPAVLQGKDVIIAVGSSSAAFPGLEPDGKNILDSTALLELQEVPKSLIIVGAGAIGLEFSDFYSAIGVKVTLVEGASQLLPTEDADIAAELLKIVKKSGRECHIGRKVTSVAGTAEGAVLRFEDGETLQADKILIAVGRVANTRGLGLETMGAALTPRGFAVVDANLQAASHCYVIGDANGRTLLAHAAEHQAEWVARRIMGRESGPYSSGPVPSCVYGHMEVMRVGSTAANAIGEGESVSISVVPFSVNPIAQAHASSAGFAKAVWAGERLVGMAAVGHGASHLVTAAQLLVLHGHTPESLHAFMFAHPTLDEILKSALLAVKTPFQVSQ